LKADTRVLTYLTGDLLREATTVSSAHPCIALPSVAQSSLGSW
jgi:hypothetical protein